MKANFRFHQKRSCEIIYIGNVSGNFMKLGKGKHTFNPLSRLYATDVQVERIRFNEKGWIKDPFGVNLRNNCNLQH